MPSALAESLHSSDNAFEAVVWWLIAAVFVFYAFRQTGPARRRCWIAAVTFLLFGFSDIVEIQTGAWWRPWWRFMWKAACVAAMAWLLYDDWRWRKKARSATVGDAE